MQNYATFQKVFDKCPKRTLAHTTGTVESNNTLNINTSDILTKLIQDTGRFAEYYASDLFISWQEVQEYLKTIDITASDSRMVVMFGIRESGVDGNEFVIARLRHSVHPPYDYVSTREYRRILALNIVVDTTGIVNRPYVTMDLKDVTHEFTRLEPEDVPDWNDSQLTEFKAQILGHGYDAVSDVLGYDYNADEDRDTVVNRLDQRIEQMTRSELLAACKQYKVKLSGCENSY